MKGYKRDVGKGSAVRPTQVSDKKFEDNWKKIFGSSAPKKNKK